MSIFQVEVEIEGREIYCVEATDKEHARRLVNECSGSILRPVVSEATGATIVTVRECQADDCG